MHPNSWCYANLVALHTLFSSLLCICMQIGSIDAACAAGQSSTITCTEPDSFMIGNGRLYCHWFQPDSINSGSCSKFLACSVCVCSCKQESACPASSFESGTVEVCRTCEFGFRGDGLTCTPCESGEVSTDPISNVCIAGFVSKCPVTRSLTCSGICACTPTTSADAGTITDWQWDYRPNSNCQYMFTSSSTVSIVLTEFETEARFDVLTIEKCESSNCASPVRLFRDSGTPAIGIYYKTDQARPFLRVTFLSNAWNQEKGFVANWAIVAPILEVCAADLIVPNCPVGQYLNSGSCSICPSHSVSPANSMAVTDCICNARYSGMNPGTCTMCAIGKYRSL